MNVNQTERGKSNQSECEATFTRAMALHRQGRAVEGSKLCAAILRIDPLHFGAWHLQGLVALQRGERERGLEMIGRSLQIQPRQPAAHSNIGNAWLEAGEPVRALTSFDCALELAPDYVVAWYNRGNALRLLQQLPEALESYERALTLNADYLPAMLNRGIALADSDRLDAALTAFDRVLQFSPNNVDAHKNRGALMLRLNRPREALESYQQALQLAPQDADVHIACGKAYMAGNHHTQAVECFSRVLQLQPDHIVALGNRGCCWQALRRPAAALLDFERALGLNSNDADTLCNLGIAQLSLGRADQALDLFDRSLRVKADRPETLIGRYHSLNSLGRRAQGREALMQLLRIHPKFDFAPGMLLHMRRDGCEWALSSPDVEATTQAVQAGERVINPFSFLSVTACADLQLRCAQIYSRSKAFNAPDRLSDTRYRHDRIRVGYVSADFREHPMSYLMTGVFEQHDRKQFEVIALSLRPPQDSPAGQRVRTAFDQFIDVSSQGDDQLAALMRELELDIAVDLMGHTDNARTEVFARRVAPVQVNYLGYPGTMGAQYMDYIIADDFVIPPTSRRHYAEQVAYLPECFQANDDRRPIAALPSRAQEGLAAEAIVLCAFNSAYKFNPNMFDIWCRVLRAAPDSVLWLALDEETARDNVRAEALRRGVSPERLVMAARVPYARHLGRLGLADLFLDTLPFNGGATASDALWSGVPVLTCCGEAFAARMAGSLLRSIGLPELIANNLEQYQELAMALTRDCDRLRALKQKLLMARSSASLFDTRRFCRHLEAAYVHMWERAERGEAPACFGPERR